MLPSPGSGRTLLPAKHATALPEPLLLLGNTEAFPGPRTGPCPLWPFPQTAQQHPLCLLQEKMLDLYWLLRVCLRTIEHGDRTGSLFAFMPEFYVSVAINSYSALKNYFGPVHSMEELPGDLAVQARRGPPRGPLV